jgi:hypothetical protein
MELPGTTFDSLQAAKEAAKVYSEVKSQGARLTQTWGDALYWKIATGHWVTAHKKGAPAPGPVSVDPPNIQNLKREQEQIEKLFKEGTITAEERDERRAEAQRKWIGGD